MRNNSTPPLATVTAVIGKVSIRTEDGSMHLLQKGDVVYTGDTVFTEEGSMAEFNTPSGELLNVTANKAVLLNAKCFNHDSEGVENLAVSPATAAGHPHEGNQEGEHQHNHGFLRIDSLYEGTTDPPYRFWSFIGKYIRELFDVRWTNTRDSGYDEISDGRATLDERIAMPLSPLAYYDELPVEVPKIIIPISGDESRLNYLPKALDEASVVIEGENSITGNVLDNDTNGTGPSRVSSITWLRDGDGAPVSAPIPLSGSITVNTLYGTLTISSDGKWSYISDPSEIHGADNVLRDRVNYTISDIDGDRASAWLVIDVLDTVPATTPTSFSVNENNLPDGTSPLPSGLIVDGSLGVIVSADDIVSTTFTIASLNPGGMTSNSLPVKYDLSSDGKTLTAYTGDNPALNKVFTVVITENDPNNPQYHFTLHERLDHADDDGTNTMVLNFGYEVTDKDGDKVDGVITVNVTDDIPTLNLSSGSTPAAVTGMVYEDALGHESDSLDRSTGNIETNGVTQIAQLSGDGGTTTGHLASLSTLISSGADEPVIFSLVTASSAVQSALGTLYSNGDTLNYSVSGGTLQATAGTDSRSIFTLTVNTGGTWSFNLNDQLDHVSDSGDTSTALQDGTGGSSMGLLNFSSLVTVTDKDQDQVILGNLTGGSNLFTVAIQNDIPIAVNDSNDTVNSLTPTFWVVEGGDITKTFLWNRTETVMNSDGLPNPLHYGISGNVLTNDKPGADESIKVTQITYPSETLGVSLTVAVTTDPAGTTVDTYYGQLTIYSDGRFEYISDPFAEHPLGKDKVLDSFTYTVEDHDKDTSQASFQVVVQDTVLTLTAPDVVTIDEANLPAGSIPNPALQTKPGIIPIVRGKDNLAVSFNTNRIDLPNTFLNSQEQTEHNEYADGLSPTDGTTFGQLTSGGEAIHYYISSVRDKIIAYTGTDLGLLPPPDGQIVFIVQLSSYNDAPINQLPYTVTLKKPIDHSSLILYQDPLTGSVLNQVVMQFSVKATELNDNDVITTMITVTVIDDETSGSRTLPGVVTPEDNAIIIYGKNADITSFNTTVPAYGILNGPQHGTVQVNNNGTLTYTPDLHYSGLDSFVFTHIDEDGVTTTETIVPVTVIAVSDTPTTGNDTLLFDSAVSANYMDMLDGTDTLLFKSGVGLDFTLKSLDTANIKSLEVIDLSVTGANGITNLDAADVFSITDSPSHNLYILGTVEDSVQLQNGLVVGGSTSETVNGNNYTMTHYTDGTSTVYVQAGVSVTQYP